MEPIYENLTITQIEVLRFEGLPSGLNWPVRDVNVFAGESPGQGDVVASLTALLLEAAVRGDVWRVPFSSVLRAGLCCAEASTMSFRLACGWKWMRSNLQVDYVVDADGSWSARKLDLAWEVGGVNRRLVEMEVRDKTHQWSIADESVDYLLERSRANHLWRMNFVRPKSEDGAPAGQNPMKVRVLTELMRRFLVEGRTPQGAIGALYGNLFVLQSNPSGNLPNPGARVRPIHRRVEGAITILGMLHNSFVKDPVTRWAMQRIAKLKGAEKALTVAAIQDELHALFEFLEILMLCKRGEMRLESTIRFDQKMLDALDHSNGNIDELPQVLIGLFDQHAIGEGLRLDLSRGQVAGDHRDVMAWLNLTFQKELVVIKHLHGWYPSQEQSEEMPHLLGTRLTNGSVHGQVILRVHSDACAEHLAHGLREGVKSRVNRRDVRTWAVSRFSSDGERVSVLP